MIPRNESALYDLMQERFGIGVWDEADPKVPYWKARGTEVAKLKAQMRRRKLTIEDLTIAVDYAYAEARPITGVWQLCDLVGVAKKARRDADRDAQRESLVEEKNEAAAQAYARGDEGWAARLYAADTESAPVVLEQWRAHMERAR